MKPSSSIFRTIALAAALAAAGSAAQAELSFVNSQAAFNAATSEPVVDSFDDLFWAEGPMYIARTVGTHSYYGYSLMPDGNYSSFYNAGTAEDLWLSTNQSIDVISLSFNTTLYGVGGFFFASDATGAFLPGQSLKLDARDANGEELAVVIHDARPDTFYGIVSSSPITIFEVSIATQPDGDYAWPTANNLTLGGMAAPVPEPAGYALLLAGLGLLALRARRR